MGGFLKKKSPKQQTIFQPLNLDWEANSPDDLRIYHKNRIFPFWFQWFQITKVDNCRWWRQGDITVDLFQGAFFMCWPWELDGTFNLLEHRTKWSTFKNRSHDPTIPFCVCCYGSSMLVIAVITNPFLYMFGGDPSDISMFVNSTLHFCWVPVLLVQIPRFFLNEICMLLPQIIQIQSLCWWTTQVSLPIWAVFNAPVGSCWLIGLGISKIGWSLSRN